MGSQRRVRNRISVCTRALVSVLTLTLFCTIFNTTSRWGSEYSYVATSSETPIAREEILQEEGKSLRIAAFIRIWPTHRAGGMQSHAFGLYHGLAQRGHTIHVITSHHAELGPTTSDVDNRLQVHYCKQGDPEMYSEEYFECTTSIFHALAPFDLIHTESNAARRFLGESSIPIVVTWHGYGYEAWRSKMNAFYVAHDLESMTKLPVDFIDEYSLMAGYQHHVTISHQSASDLKQVMYLDENRVHLILNGVDLTNFKPNDAVKTEFRRRNSIHELGLVLGVGGKLTTMKGSQLLLQKVPALVDFKDFPVYFVVAGVGEQLSAWYQIAKEFPGRVFVLGPKSPEGMIEFYQSLDIFINPTSYYQGLDLTMQEAMACGVPVLASLTGSIGETIMSPHDGVIPGGTFALGDASSLYDAILQLGRDRSELYKKGKAAQAKAQTEFQLSRMLSEYEKLFQTLVDSHDTEYWERRMCGSLCTEAKTSTASFDLHATDKTDSEKVMRAALDIVSSKSDHHNYTVCVLSGSDVWNTYAHLYKGLIIFELSPTSKAFSIGDVVSRCDMLYIDQQFREHESTEMWASMHRILKCDGTVFYVSHSENFEIWNNAVHSAMIRELGCSQSDDHGMKWCFGSSNAEPCWSSGSWTEPPDVNDRADGDYIWSIGMFETENLAHFKHKYSSNLPSLSGRNIIDVRGEYVADPFVIERDGTYFMYFEVWNIDKKLGNIGLATSVDGVAWKYERVVLSEPFHMSYPYVFEEAGVYYMIPETHAVAQVRLYRSEVFPLVWKPQQVLLDEDLCDASVVQYDGKWFMFASPPTNDRVVLYVATNLLDSWQLHPSSPVLEGKAQGRPAGRIIRQGDLRLAQSTGLVIYIQDCSGAYGRGVNAFNIVELSDSSARLERMVNDSGLYGNGMDRHWARLGMHHVSVFKQEGDKWLAAVDGWRLRPKDFEFT